jgi:NADH-quinone oxidoreductase subunit J
MEAIVLCLGISLIIFSFCVINVSNPVHSALYLVCSFLNAALILFLIGADFLGFVFILVYVGAIAVFFLLVIMMLNIKSDPATMNFIKYGPLSFFIGFIFVFEFFMPFVYNTTIINYNTFSSDIYWTKLGNTAQIIENCQNFGQILYTNYFVFFLILGLILLIALLGSMMLTVSASNRDAGDFIE